LTLLKNKGWQPVVGPHPPQVAILGTFRLDQPSKNQPHTPLSYDDCQLNRLQRLFIYFFLSENCVFNININAIWLTLGLAQLSYDPGRS
jgi:hypothetical protein